MISGNSKYNSYIILVISVLAFSNAYAQELEPRALTNLPVGTNFAMLGYGFSQGNVLYDPALPLEDVYAQTHALVGAYVRSFNFLGMGAKANIIAPFAAGDWDGIYNGVDTSTARSGMADLRFGLSLNFIGSPALDKTEYSDYNQKSIVGFSMQVIAPTGQYFDDKLINLGSNRWAFRPQIGVSHKIKSWYIEYAINAWLYTRNYSFWDGNKLSQNPIGTFKLTFTRSFKKGIWVALGGGYALGGRAEVNDVEREAKISTIRAGVIVAVPVHPQHNLKFTAIIARRFEQGADFDSFGIAYQYMWNRKN